MQINNKKLKGILSDIDGVLMLDNKLLDNVLDTYNMINKQNIPIRFLTNTTSQTREEIHGKLQKAGLNVDIESIFTPITVVKEYMRRHNYKHPYLFVSKSVSNEFLKYNINNNDYDCIIFGDKGEDFYISELDKIFDLMMHNLPLFALQKNRNYKKNGKLVMDIGAYVAALEFASGKTALNMGKPADLFFSIALDSMNLQKDEVIMIGDDIEFDVLGAQKVGISAILVKTGKYCRGQEDLFAEKPFLILDKFADLKQFLFD